MHQSLKTLARNDPTAIPGFNKISTKIKFTLDPYMIHVQISYELWPWPWLAEIRIHNHFRLRTDCSWIMHDHCLPRSFYLRRGRDCRAEFQHNWATIRRTVKPRRTFLIHKLSQLFSCQLKKSYFTNKYLSILGIFFFFFNSQESKCRRLWTRKLDLQFFQLCRIKLLFFLPNVCSHENQKGSCRKISDTSNPCIFLHR